MLLFPTAAAAHAPAPQLNSPKFGSRSVLPLPSAAPAPQLGSSKFGSFEVEVIDPVEDYMATLKVRALQTAVNSTNY